MLDWLSCKLISDHLPIDLYPHTLNPLECKCLFPMKGMTPTIKPTVEKDSLDVEEINGQNFDKYKTLQPLSPTCMEFL